MNHKNLHSLFAAISMLSCVSMVGMDIWKAVDKDDLKQIKQMVEKDKSIVNKQDDFGYTPLYLATRYRNLDIVKYLIKKGASVNIPSIHGYTALHEAACSGRLELAKRLIENGARMDANNNSEGWTPLHFAAENGHLEVVKALLGYLFLQSGGAALLKLLETKASDGKTAADLANQSCKFTVIRLLAKFKSRAEQQLKTPSSRI